MILPALDAAAAELRERHLPSSVAPHAIPLWAELRSLEDWLARARVVCADPPLEAAKAAEWLLDNAFQVERALAQLERDLPPGFYRRLPSLAGGPGAGLPRIFGVAHGLLDASRLQVTLASAGRYVNAYQEQGDALSIAELWAFPSMLRLACLELLTAAFARLVPELAPPRPPTALATALLVVDDTDCVARAVANLGVVAAIPWKEFFARTSVVEAILCDDPDGSYADMDFETRDRYRQAIEDIAYRTARMSETELASCVVERARSAAPNSLERHVGWWLTGRGRLALERSLGTRVPWTTALRRWCERRAGPLYLAALAAAIATLGALPLLYLISAGAGPGLVALGTLLGLLPASALGVTVVNWLVTLITPPRVLPKLDFSTSIAEDCRTAVVMPVLVASRDEVAAVVQRLEGHFLANPDPALSFALLSDLPDAECTETPGDAALIEALVSAVRALNDRHPQAGRPFHLLHRARSYNPADGCWMGWERKRGKLEELNDLIAGEASDAFAFREGDTSALERVRFVVTVDADTLLPTGSVARLISILAHPMNRAALDQEGRVRRGYTIVQPRVEISPEAGSRSWFARIFSGDTAIDIYSRAVSDVYQDLFATGIYVGKGIYDVRAFRASIAGRVPDNALVSHDLFEGLHGRVALASDVIVYEDFPRSYVEFAYRTHRWVRGDWQLLPWLRRHVPGAAGQRLPNRLGGLARAQILDNLRRSLIAPSLLAMLAAGWLLLPGSPLVWTLLGVLAPAAHLFTELVTGLARGRRRGVVQGVLEGLVDSAGRWLLALVFLANDATLALDAIVRTLWRIGVSRRRLLEWTSAAHSASTFAARNGLRAAIWRELWHAPAVAVGLGLAITWLRPSSWPWAAPLLLAWLLAPELALYTSRPREWRAEPLGEQDRMWLRRLARRTWLFFETFVGPDDHWLPPDNYQQEPRGELAHRTSPTNIGMLLLSSVTAYDLGYLGLPELAARLRNTLDSLDRLPRYRGHLLNWYDTRSLDPLEPRYVSTVDSGNLGLCLLTLKESCREFAVRPPHRASAWDGLTDALSLLEEALAEMPAEQLHAVAQRLVRVRELAREARADPRLWRKTAEELCEHECPEIERVLVSALRLPGAQHAGLREVRIWLERLHHHMRALQRELDALSPWLALMDAPARGGEELAFRMGELLPATLSLAETARRTEEAGRLLMEPSPAANESPELAQWRARLAAAVEQGAKSRIELGDGLRALAGRARDMALGMDFRWLFDSERRLFHIGYSATADRLDANHYDLLASEARLASFFAIAKSDVPTEHWFFLGRPLTRAPGGLTLLSWGGSMFEYLMPPLLLRSQPHTLLGRSERAAVATQRRHARSLGIPWGVSESAFAAMDAGGTYRYRAFGVPGLGLRRGLSRDRVVAPYATALALPVVAGAAVDNLRALSALGLAGTYGMLEAADFTPERVVGSRPARVHAYMAHHQGMLLAAIGNALCDDVLVRRLQRDRRVRGAALLLQERSPRGTPLEAVREAPPAPHPGQTWAPRGLFPWAPPRGGGAQLHALGNGRLTSWISAAGSGGLRWHEHALTRWLPDATREDHGHWIYVRDEESGELWSAGRQPTDAMPEESHVAFHAHLAEFHRRDHGVALSLEVCVAPGDDLEIRRLTLVNDTDRARSLVLTSYCEVALAPPLEDERHPAFSKLFVHAEILPGRAGLLFTRRPRQPGDRPPCLLHRVVHGDSDRIEVIGFSADRRAFLGRGRDARRPDGALGVLDGAAGFTLDPALAIQVRVELQPFERAQLAFVTFAAGSPESLLELRGRYTTLASLDWAITAAASEAVREAHNLGLAPERLPVLQTIASLLLQPEAALRAATAVLSANRLGQPRLWGLGLSGDLPILLLRVSDPETSGLLPDLLRAHVVWRRLGIHVDLAIVRGGASGYVEPLRDRVQAQLQELGAGEQLGRRGGVHLVFPDQLDGETLRLVEATARVVLDDDAGSLESQLARVVPLRAALPRFEPALAVAAERGVLPRPTDLQFDNGFGGFTRDGRAYVIQLEPGESTPAPWCNVLANDGFGTLVSEAGLGFCWATNAGERRLTPWSNDPVTDPPGEVLYLRDEETAEVWTPTPQPAGDTTSCQVRHEAGATVWRRVSHGLEQELRVCVPPDDPVKLAVLRLRNTSARPRRITATYYAEWQLGALRSVARPAVVCEYDSAHHALLALSAWDPDFAERVAFLTANVAPHGVTADRLEFLGRLGTPRRPAALTRWGLSGRVAAGDDPCGAYQVHFDLAPGASEEVVFVLGEGRDRAAALELARRWTDPAQAMRGMQAAAQRWDELTGALQVETPDAALDLLVNRWLPLQAMASRILARAGFYQAGGAFGFRDQIQDVLAFLISDPARARAQLLACAAHQFQEGDVLHWWHPPSGRGVRTRCSDDLLWLPYAVCAYVEATGDSAVLDEELPFLEAQPLAAQEQDRYARFDVSRDRRSLFEHCERALERGATRGAHGLPLIGAGDWNDGMDRVGSRGRGESVWLAWFSAAAMTSFARLAERRGIAALAHRWRERAQELVSGAEATAWDGRWYVRAFDDDGRAWGSAAGDECRIDSIAQSWAVLSGAADPERARAAVYAAERELYRPEADTLALLWPPFDATPRDPGYIKAYPPGVRENGGQYSHAAAWLGLAFAELGDGDAALRVLALLSPIRRAATRAGAERYRLEPYVMAGDIGSASPHAGRGGWSWYTGSAAWTWRLCVEGILGLRLRDGHLSVSPRLPKDWSGFTARVRGPAGSLAVRVVRDELADPLPASGVTLPFPVDGSELEIEIRMPRGDGAPSGASSGAPPAEEASWPRP